MIALVLALAVAGLITTDRGSRRAIGSYCLIYLAGTVMFRMLALSHHVSGDSYLMIMSTMSTAQIAVYATLPARAGIIAAGACEVVLLATYGVAFFRVPEFLPHRVAIWQGVNFLAILALFGDWWRHGLPRLAGRHQWLRTNRAMGASAGGQRLVRRSKNGRMGNPVVEKKA